MKLHDVFPSNYLKSEDLQGRDALVVIATASIEKVGDDHKLVLTFQHKKKGMICNKTNANRIAYLYGDDTDNWIGREIVITSEFVEYQGKTVKGLRVKPPPEKGQPSVAAGNGNYELKSHGQFSTGGPRSTPPLDEKRGDPIPYSHDETVPF